MPFKPKTNQRFLKVLLGVLFLSFLPLAATAEADGETATKQANVVVSKQWLRAVPPVSKMTAGYMTLHNNDDQSKKLVSVTTPIAGVVEIHEVFKDGERTGMRPVKSLELPANGELVLKPSGYHLMLINLKQALNTGEKLPLTLHFDNGESLSIHSEVKMQMEGDSGETTEDKSEGHHHHH